MTWRTKYYSQSPSTLKVNQNKTYTDVDYGAVRKFDPVIELSSNNQYYNIGKKKVNGRVRASTAEFNVMGQVQLGKRIRIKGKPTKSLALKINYSYKALARAWGTGDARSIVLLFAFKDGKGFPTPGSRKTLASSRLTSISKRGFGAKVSQRKPSDRTLVINKSDLKDGMVIRVGIGIHTDAGSAFRKLPFGYGLADIQDRVSDGFTGNAICGSIQATWRSV